MSNTVSISAYGFESALPTGMSKAIHTVIPCGVGKRQTGPVNGLTHLVLESVVFYCYSLLMLVVLAWSLFLWLLSHLHIGAVWYH